MFLVITLAPQQCPLFLFRYNASGSVLFVWQLKRSVLWLRKPMVKRCNRSLSYFIEQPPSGNSTKREIILQSSLLHFPQLDDFKLTWMCLTAWSVNEMSDEDFKYLDTHTSLYRSHYICSLLNGAYWKYIFSLIHKAIQCLKTPQLSKSNMLVIFNRPGVVRLLRFLPNTQKRLLPCVRLWGIA